MVMALIVGWQMDAQYKYGFTKVTTHGQVATEVNITFLAHVAWEWG